MLTGATLVAWPESDLSALPLTAAGAGKNWLVIGLVLLALALLCYWMLKDLSTLKAYTEKNLKPGYRTKRLALKP